MFRMRPKRPILRAQLAAANPTRHRSIAGSNQLALAAGTGGRKRAEVCWWTGYPDYAKCCSYEGIALPYCVTYPDVGDD